MEAPGLLPHFRRICAVSLLLLGVCSIQLSRFHLVLELFLHMNYSLTQFCSPGYI